MTNKINILLSIFASIGIIITPFSIASGEIVSLTKVPVGLWVLCFPILAYVIHDYRRINKLI